MRDAIRRDRIASYGYYTEWNRGWVLYHEAGPTFEPKMIDRFPTETEAIRFAERLVRQRTIRSAA